MSQYETLRRIISETLCVPLKLVTPDALLYPDLGVSLDLVEMIMACEEEFQISIPDEDTAKSRQSATWQCILPTERSEAWFLVIRLHAAIRAGQSNLNSFTRL